MRANTRSFAQDRARSYRNLDTARQEAAKSKDGYSSSSTRAQVSSAFRERFDADPHDWQLDVMEAILLGLDSIVIAGTGAGKTMPFMMPLLLDEKKKVIIISPLKVLQEDQAERFEKMQLSAKAVNGDTWNGELKKDLENGRYRGILTSPEMCLKHDGFREILSGSSFKDICAVIIDEAHCMAQWGGDFRPAYGDLSKLRSFPSHIPIFATSATLNPTALQEVRSQLAIDADECFFLNLGNDRPNIAYSVLPINSSTDYDALKPLLSRKPNPSTADDLVKSIVFVNAVTPTQLTARTIRSWFPKHLRKYVDYMHAHRTPKAKRRSMRRLRKGRSRILVATEVAGMGADIPDIELVVQFGVPSSLSVWIQRAGRAGRSSNINARAVLMVEQSMFKRKKVKRRKKKTTPDEEDEDEDEADKDEEVMEENVDRQEEGELGGDEHSGDDEDLEDEEDDATYIWCKSVDDDLRRWIETKHCRRDIADEYFGNPPNRKPPTHACCDNCDGVPVNVDDLDVRPVTPEMSSSNAGSAPTTPSKSADENGKRKLTKPPGTRRGALLESARNALLRWRFQTKLDRYSPSSVQ